MSREAAARHHPPREHHPPEAASTELFARRRGRSLLLLPRELQPLLRKGQPNGAAEPWQKELCFLSPPPMPPGSSVSESARGGWGVGGGLQETLREGACIRESKGAASLSALATLTPASSPGGWQRTNSRLLSADRQGVVWSLRSPLLHQVVTTGPPPSSQRRGTGRQR